VRYADYALGYFLREAEKQPWFDDTIFVVVADHGARVYGKADIPLDSYEIPLMIYAPKHLAPQRVDTLMTQIDVAPTVLGLLGLPYDALGAIPSSSPQDEGSGAWPDRRPLSPVRRSHPRPRPRSLRSPRA
jgi:phosphoglycerol transferase MdoB-like AlkP superfamily enzyme